MGFSIEKEVMTSIERLNVEQVKNWEILLVLDLPRFDKFVLAVPN